ncbi:MAG: hypothetical protein HS111_09950 [Kofleriaceae bacterium]|nr:hypothetical protein [Kofleriaceae bacterium]
MEYDSAHASWLYTVLYLVRKLIASEERDATVAELEQVMRDGRGPAYDALTMVRTARALKIRFTCGRIGYYLMQTFPKKLKIADVVDALGVKDESTIYKCRSDWRKALRGDGDDRPLTQSELTDLLDSVTEDFKQLQLALDEKSVLARKP